MKKQLLFHVFCFALFFAAFWLNGLSERRRASITDDADQYMAMAYNIAHHFSASFSDCPDDSCVLEPTPYRPPGYSAFLALGILSSPQLRRMDLKSLHLSENLDPLRNRELFVLMLTAIIAFFTTLQLSGQPLAAYVALFVIGLNPLLVEYQNEFYGENFAAFLVALVSLLLVLTIKRQNVLLTALSGLLLGCLALTSAIFYYLFFALFVFLLWFNWRQKKGRRIIAGQLTAFSLAFFLVVGPWMIRNYLHFDRAFIASRGGPQLNMRAEKDTMNSDEYVACFFYWSNCRYIRTLRMPFEGKPEFARLDRSNPNSFYRVGKRPFSEMQVEMTAKIDRRIPVDKELINIGMKRILSNPLKHLAVSIPIAYRGMSVQQCGIDLILFVSWVALTITALYRKEMALLAFLIPSLFLFAFYALLTYYLPRYSIPILPTLWTSAIVLLARATTKAER